MSKNKTSKNWSKNGDWSIGGGNAKSDYEKTDLGWVRLV